MSEQIAKTRSAAQIELQIARLIGHASGLRSAASDTGNSVEIKMEQARALIWAISPELGWSEAWLTVDEMMSEHMEDVS